MDNVIPLKRPEKKELVWECNCGCQVFYVNCTHASKMHLECAECNKTVKPILVGL